MFDGLIISSKTTFHNYFRLADGSDIHKCQCCSHPYAHEQAHDQIQTISTKSTDQQSDVGTVQSE